MKKLFEPLKAEKFKPLPPGKLQHIQGGTATPGSSEIVGTEIKNRKTLANGEIYYEYRFIYKTWSSDDLTNGVTCLYGIGESTSDWRHT